ncbi:hypothetical protein ABZ695_23125 [Streptomyces sp. NPDC006976]|uniref:hypothetical protein n=1 Tax=Streptomyces sp. NPDC006976 TaxID=3154311 RepID=UPI0033D96FBB
MHRSRALTVPLIALAAAALALTGCSSDSDDSKKDASGSSASAPADAGKDDKAKDDEGSEPAGDGKGSAQLSYKGGASGEVSIKSVGCAVMNGKLAAITAPDSADSSTPAKPSFTAVVTDDKAMTTLTTNDGTSYLHTSAPGITGSKSGGTWVITVAGLELGPTDPTGDSITVDGTITCGSVAGM